MNSSQCLKELDVQIDYKEILFLITKNIKRMRSLNMLNNALFQTGD